MKKHKITVAQTYLTDQGPLLPVVFDIDVLRTSHALITGVSGSGKSYAIRVLIEQVAAIFPIFVIDPEGEYASLREKFSFVLVGEGGDIPIHPNTAATTAQRLMKLNVSAIFDLSSLPLPSQHLWVKNFFDAMMALKRSEWHPLFLVVDEAHVFCPEEGSSIAHDVMKDIAKRGRKRGWMQAWATQRLSSLDKEAAAELQNTVIGRTTLHTDRERAFKILGVLKREQEDFFKRLKVLQPGEFYFQGVAVSADMVLGKIIAAQTRHPEPGTHKEITFPTPAQIRALLPELSQITEDAVEAEKKKQSLEDEVKNLREQLAALQQHPPGPDPVEMEALRQADATHYQGVMDTALVRYDQEWADRFLALIERFKGFADVANGWIVNLGVLQTQVLRGAEEMRTAYAALKESLAVPNAPDRPKVFFLNEQHELPRPAAGQNGDGPAQPKKRKEPTEGGKRGPGRAERRMLRVLALTPNGCSRLQLGIRSVYAYEGGGFKKGLSNLRSWGMVLPGEPIKITDAGKQTEHDLVPKPGIDLRNAWMETLGKAEKALFDAVWNGRMTGALNGISKESVGRAAGYEHNGGAFKKALSNLRSLGLVEGKENLLPTAFLF